MHSWLFKCNAKQCKHGLKELLNLGIMFIHICNSCKHFEIVHVAYL